MVGQGCGDTCSDSAKGDGVFLLGLNGALKPISNDKGGKFTVASKDPFVATCQSECASGQKGNITGGVLMVR